MTFLSNLGEAFIDFGKMLIVAAIAFAFLYVAGMGLYCLLLFPIT